MNLSLFSLAGTQKYLGRSSRAFLKVLGLGRRGRPLHFGTREKLDEILKKGEEGGREEGQLEEATQSWRLPKKWTHSSCVPKWERKGGRSGGSAARSLLVPFDSSLGTDWERRGRGAPAAAARAVDAL